MSKIKVTNVCGPIYQILKNVLSSIVDFILGDAWPSLFYTVCLSYTALDNLEVDEWGVHTRCSKILFHLMLLLHVVNESFFGGQHVVGWLKTFSKP